MSLSLFHKVSPEAIETLLDMKNQPLFIEKIRNKFRDFQLHSTHVKPEVLAVGLTSAWSGMLGGGKDPQDVFINLPSWCYRDGCTIQEVQSSCSGKMTLQKGCCRKYRRSISKLLKNVSKLLHCSKIILEIVTSRRRQSSMKS